MIHRWVACAEAMLLVVCSDDARVTATRVRSLSPHGCVQIESLASALQVLRRNPIDAVIAIGGDEMVEVLAAICQRYPHLDCYLLGRLSLQLAPRGRLAPGSTPERAPPESGPLRSSQLPEQVRHFAEPIDWRNLQQQLNTSSQRGRKRSGSSASRIEAIGLENILNLLAITGVRARVDVVAGRKHGHLELASGHLVHAERGHRCGLSVAQDIVSWHEPRVTATVLEEEGQRRTLDLPIDALLQLSGRRQAELRRLRSSKPIGNLLNRMCHIEGCLGAGVFHSEDELSIRLLVSDALEPQEARRVSRRLRELAVQVKPVAPTTGESDREGVRSLDGDPREDRWKLGGRGLDGGSRGASRNAKDKELNAEGAIMRWYSDVLVFAIPIRVAKSDAFVLCVAYDACIPVENVHRTAAHAALVLSQVFERKQLAFSTPTAQAIPN